MLSLEELLSTDFSPADQDQLWHCITAYHCADEETMLRQLLDLAPNPGEACSRASGWITALREERDGPLSVSRLFARFGLDSAEGIALLALAEALLRIPDQESAEALIRDKLSPLDPLAASLDQANDLLTSSTLWGLLLSQQLIAEDDQGSVLKKLLQKLGSQSLYSALRLAMSHLGKQFVFAETIQDALQQQVDFAPEKTTFSFDMLGEAALCEEDVEGYFNAYLEAIQAAGDSDNSAQSSISIKLSALHPRLENSQLAQLQSKLLNRLFQLLVVARQREVAITIDAEESERLELSLLIFEQLLRSEIGSGWGKLGLAVQAYSKRALPVLRWLSLLAEDCATEIPVRLVKGAYWDSEIKRAQQAGLPHYPVFTQKAATDLSYLCCSRFLLSAKAKGLQPQFATHNALTLAQILTQSSHKTFEFQRLHGMGEALYRQVQLESEALCRIYAPVGEQETLLPYLVRRLLENASNSSFVFRFSNDQIPVSDLVRSPHDQIQPSIRTIPLPDHIYQPQRENSAGENLATLNSWQHWQTVLEQYAQQQWYCQPIIGGEVIEGSDLQPVHSPHQQGRLLGYLSQVDQEQIRQAIAAAEHQLPAWSQTPLSERCDLLRRYAERLQDNREELVSLCMLEAGKVLSDALSELREAIDFCYYYARQAEQTLQSEQLVSVTGESNQLNYLPRGVFLCISPWNFPLAIFTGQIAAALVAGNCVLAKPSSRTSLIAFKAAQLWYEAGLPLNALQLLPCKRDTQSSTLLNDSRITGVAFTGSCASSLWINQQLANRHDGAIVSLIAETGGINTMIADSSALPEQLIRDVIRSAFNSAGQRCSALRVLYLQEEIADQIEERLQGAMRELRIGSPEQLSCDVGPVIDKTAMDRLYQHIERCRVQGRLLYELPLEEEHNQGFFVPPTLIRLQALEQLEEEIFGPVLHLIRYRRDDLERVIQEINRSGFGLTLGIHSRNNQFIDQICARARVGNIYINRDQVGAIVAAQPFGGMGMSGTGPKAGGPNYLRSFVREQTLSRDTTASGGDLSLLSRTDPGALL